MLSGIVTAILLALFVIGALWAYSPRRRSAFEAAARLPLEDAPPAAAATDAPRTADASVDTEDAA
jgi:cytochrome c oxidase cbb3-type subunit IV